MTEVEMLETRSRLEQLRQEVLREVRQADEASRNLDSGDVADIGDMSTLTYDRDVIYNLSEVQRKTIRDIDAAIEEIDSGDYGVCRRCSEEIPAKRLAVRPFSRFCVDCMAEVERFGE